MEVLLVIQNESMFDCVNSMLRVTNKKRWVDPENVLLQSGNGKLVYVSQ